MIFKTIILVLIHTSIATATKENNPIRKILGLDWLKPVSESYDFIIVGGGSAGCVIASRLSEVPQWKVLLLEAGDKEDELSEVPALVSMLQFTKYFWRYYIESQPGIALGYTNNQMPCPRGKALGGTSVINYMLFTRGPKYDYDKWAMLGNPGWSYKDVLPYFTKSENVALKSFDPKYHGKGGYLRIEDAYQSKISTAFIEGLNELGVPTVDHNANLSVGVSTLQGNTLKGKRLSAARAFLEPVKHRPNLHILTNAFVTKLLINQTTKEAYGVEFERFGLTHETTASKEVILSAGAFNSPQLLILSGIGPKDHLEELGVPLVKNLSVGQNMQDHLGYLGLSFTTNQPVTLHYTDVLNPFNFYKLHVQGTGPFTSLGGSQAIAYIKTKQTNQTEDTPDIELLFAASSLAQDFGISGRRSMGISDKVYNTIYKPLEGSYSFTVVPMLLHPKSKGYLKLRSKDPHVYPLLYGNYMTDPENKDMKTLLTAIRYVQKLANTEAFKKFNATLNTIPVPGCEHNKFDSKVYWKCCLRSLAQTSYHQVGTAKMGPSKDPDAVVSPELKVYGIGRLRVADCSVIPFAIGAHTNAPAIMVGEKAADLIKADWIKN